MTNTSERQSMVNGFHQDGEPLKRTFSNGIDDTIPPAEGGEPLLPDDHLPLPQLCARISDRIQTFLGEEPRSERIRRVQEQTRISLRVIKEALGKYDLPAISLSYNGGKDCLVLLILYLAALSSHPSFQQPSSTSPLIQTVYVVSPHPFPQVESFVNKTSHVYSLSITRYAEPMKAAFTDYLSDFPLVRAIFVGTRRTDPHGASLTHFDQTDHGWPSFMRVHPVIDWQYVDIWTFIRHLGIAYCPLYDRGYTSLGGTRDTNPNPALRRESMSEASKTPIVEFRPAYELLEDGEERLGREKEWRPTAGSGLMHQVKGSANDVAVFDDDDDDDDDDGGAVRA